MDVNIRISREAYDAFAIKAVRRQQRIKKRVTIKSLVEEAAKLIEV